MITAKQAAHNSRKNETTDCLYMNSLDEIEKGIICAMDEGRWYTTFPKPISDEVKVILTDLGYEIGNVDYTETITWYDEEYFDEIQVFVERK